MALRVSIVIPCFNRARLIGRAIESALAQGPACEVIVVDDGSTDRSAEVIAGYPQVRLISQPNSGVGAARNAGVGAARGEFIKFLDSDDTLPPEAVAGLLTAAAGLAPKQIAFGRGRTVDADGRDMFHPTYGYPEVRHGCELDLRQLLNGIMSPVLPLFPRSALVTNGGFHTGLALGEDHQLAVRLHRAGFRFVACDTLACLITEHGDARLSRLAPALQAERTLAQWDAVRSALGSDLEDDSAAADALAKRIWIDAREAARRGAAGPAERLFALAAELSSAAGSAAPMPLRLLYRGMSPVRAEGWLERAKGLRRLLSIRKLASSPRP